MKIVDKQRYQDMLSLQSAARGETPVDLVITNCRLVNVLTGEIHPATLHIHKGIIVYVEPGEQPAPFQAARVFDAKGAYVAPGLMDSHVHEESSMLTPYHFGRALAPHGTTTIFPDPHEIGNVAGKPGVAFMKDNAEQSPIRRFFLIPSCVPAVPGLEETGASFVAADVAEMAAWEGAIGLAEVMDYVNVARGEQRMHTILAAAEQAGLYRQGHYSLLRGRELASYLLRVPGGNHELRDPAEALETLRAGGWVDIRGGSSIADDFEALVRAVLSLPSPALARITFCTDDVHAADLVDRAHGHINKLVARAIRAGMDPVQAVACATRNVAAEYGIANLGAIQAGNLADCIVFDSFETLEPTAVFVGGEQIVADGRLIVPEIPRGGEPEERYAQQVLHTVKLDALQVGDFVIEAPAGVERVTVNVLDSQGIVSHIVQESLPVKAGCLDLSDRPDLAFAAVLNRYGTGGKTLAVIKGFGVQSGAAASTVSHDSHNMTVVYRDPALAAKLAEEIRLAGGGIGATDTDGETRKAPLPIGGLMSEKNAEAVAAEIAEMEAWLSRLTGGKPFPLLYLAILALPVVPEARITDKGIVDVFSQKFVPLFA